MKADIFIYMNKRLEHKLTVYIKNLKQRLKTAKEYFISSIETVLFYKSEIKLQLKVFIVNSRNDINRF